MIRAQAPLAHAMLVCTVQPKLHADFVTTCICTEEEALMKEPTQVCPLHTQRYTHSHTQSCHTDAGTDIHIHTHSHTQTHTYTHRHAHSDVGEWLHLQ